MKIKIDELAEIHEYGSTRFFVGKILSCGSDYLCFKNVTTTGIYSGCAIIAIKGISNIKYSTEYLSFYKAILADTQEQKPFKTPRDMILSCFENNEIIEISKFSWDDYVYSLRIIEIANDYFIGQRVSDTGKLLAKIKIKYRDVYYIIFGTQVLRNYKKYLEMQKQ